MDLTFTTTLVPWRGPAPFVFAPASEDAADAIAEVASRVTYGWGAIPAAVRLTPLADPEDGPDEAGPPGRGGGAGPGTSRTVAYTTSLFPREGTYYVPVKVAVQRRAQVGVGDDVRIALHLELRR